MADLLEDHLDAMWTAAEAAREHERFAAAAELLSSYLRHRPGHAWAWHRYGDALGNLGLWAEAERAILQAIDLQSDPFWSHVRLARIYRSKGDHESAEEQFAIALQLPKADGKGWVWIQRGANLARMNRLEDALKCHRRSLTMTDADHDEAHLNIGLILRATGNYAASAEAFRRALEFTPDYPEASHGLASLEGIDEAILLARSIPGG